MLVFVTRTGRPWALPHLRHEIQRVMAEIGFPGYTLHGLRYKAARRLRLAGADWEDIAAVTGHRAMRMARQYAEKSERATNAIQLLSAKRADGAAKQVDRG
jgi:integrase